MFSGIVEQQGELISIEHSEHQAKLWIAASFDQLTLGESIAVDGVCLTVTEISNDRFACDVSPETLRVTIAGQYDIGQSFNLERAMRWGDRVGGHLVAGHVDQVATVTQREPVNDYLVLKIGGVHANAQRYLVPKGSVAINGVSLTINEIIGDQFSVMLIPHTLSETNFSQLRVGDKVNLEFDQLVKMIARQLQFSKTHSQQKEPATYEL